MVSLPKIIIVLLGFSIFYPFKSPIFAYGEGSKTQKYINSTTDLNVKKRKSKKSTNKFNSRKIKSLIKKESTIHGNNKLSDVDKKNSDQSGITTKNLVKKNRWFVKKPFQKSFNKISSIKRIKRPQVDYGKNNEISLKASKYTKKRAKETSPKKIDPRINKEISIEASKYSKKRAKETNSNNIDPRINKEISIEAFKYSKKRARETGSKKPEIIFAKNSSRVALDLSKTRARETGTVKPQIIYSDRVSREAYKLTSKKNNRKLSYKPTFKGQRYSAELLRSMGRKAPIKKINFSFRNANVLNKSNIDNKTSD